MLKKLWYSFIKKKQQILTRNFIVVDDCQTSAKLSSKQKFPSFYTDAESLQAFIDRDAGRGGQKRGTPTPFLADQITLS